MGDYIINSILNELGLKAAAFAKSIEVHPTQIYDLKTGKTKTISNSMAGKILKVYPQFNKLYLLTGEGDMLRSKDSNAVFMGNAKPAIAEDTVSVRYFEVTPTATFQEFCAGTSENPSNISILPTANETLDDSYCVFEVSGESMAPQIQNHSRVLCQEIPPTRWHNLNDCVVVIAYADKFVIKRIALNHLSAENYIVLSSDNPEYPTRETVQLSDIRAIFKAKRIISQDII